MVREGKLFVIEGPDGSGKSTMVSHLATRMHNSGFYTEGMALPNSDSKLYEEIRKYLKCKNLDVDILQNMMIQNMDDCFAKIILPKLEQGINIILDRWAISTIIYNFVGNGSLIESEYITNQNEIDLERIVRRASCFKWPDKIYYLNTPKFNILNVSMTRFVKDEDEEVFDKLSNIGLVYNAYQEFMKAIVDRKKKFKGYRIYEFITSTNKDRHRIVDPEYGVTTNQNYLSMEDKIYFDMLKDVGVI